MEGACMLKMREASFTRPGESLLHACLNGHLDCSQVGVMPCKCLQAEDVLSLLVPLSQALLLHPVLSFLAGCACQANLCRRRACCRCSHGLCKYHSQLHVPSHPVFRRRTCYRCFRHAPTLPPTAHWRGSGMALARPLPTCATSACSYWLSWRCVFVWGSVGMGVWKCRAVRGWCGPLPTFVTSACSCWRSWRCVFLWESVGRVCGSVGRSGGGVGKAVATSTAPYPPPFPPPSTHRHPPCALDPCTP